MDLKVEINGNLLPDDNTGKANDKRYRSLNKEWKKTSTDGGNRHRKYICTHIFFPASSYEHMSDSERCRMSHPFNFVDVLHLRLFA